ECLAVLNGFVAADPERDLAKIAVVKRHHKTERIDLGLVRSFGLRSGAFTSTVTHDAHNLIIINVGNEDMALCATRAQKLDGKLIMANNGTMRNELALPITKLLSDTPTKTIATKLKTLQALLRAQDVTIDTPFITLSFLTLSIIP